MRHKKANIASSWWTWGCHHIDLCSHQQEEAQPSSVAHRELWGLSNCRGNIKDPGTMVACLSQRYRPSLGFFQNSCLQHKILLDFCCNLGFPSRSLHDQERSPEGGHGNFLPGKTLWTEEPGGIQSMGSQSRIWWKWLSTHAGFLSRSMHYRSFLTKAEIRCISLYLNFEYLKQGVKRHNWTSWNLLSN